MALKKTKTLPDGTSGEYWRIAQMNINFDRLDGVSTIELFGSKAIRDTGNTPMGEQEQRQLQLDYLDREITLKDDTVIKMKDLIRREAYEAWKLSDLNENKEEQNFFADALDI